MKPQWERLEAWLKSHGPALLVDLNPPASDGDIRELEQALGVQLPADFVACLQVHDGQRGGAEGLFAGQEFLSCRRILSEWAIWKDLLDSGDFDGAQAEPGAGVQPVWWHPRWIPFTYNGAGDHLCLDLEPADGGQPGQVITLWHDDGARQKKADSFAQWFAAFVEQTTRLARA